VVAAAPERPARRGRHARRHRSLRPQTVLMRSVFPASWLASLTMPSRASPQALRQAEQEASPVVLRARSAAVRRCQAAPEVRSWPRTRRRSAQPPAKE